MAVRLDYADPLAATKVRVTSLPNGGTAIEVPPSRTVRVPLVPRFCAALVVIVCFVLGVLLMDGPLFPLAFGLFAGMLLAMGFLVWSSVAPPAERRAGVRLSASWQDGMLTLIGPGNPTGPQRLDGPKIIDVRVDFDGGMEGASPLMRITLSRLCGAPVLLLAEQDPADLLLVAGLLRRLLGLPTRPQRMAAWFSRMSAGAGAVAAMPIPDHEDGPVPVMPIDAEGGLRSVGRTLTDDALAVVPVAADRTAARTPQAAAAPVLAYATPERIKGLVRGHAFTPGGMTLWFNCDAARAAFISTTASRILIVWRDGVEEFESAGVYGFYVGAASELAPLTLYVCTLSGVYGVLAGVEPKMLRQAARLLNDMLGVEGSVYSIDAK